MKSTVQFLCGAILIAWAPLKADSFETILNNLGLKTSIAGEIETGLKALAEFDGDITQDKLFELFEDMNETLQTEYKAESMDADQLKQKMADITRIITTLKTNISPINSSNFANNKTTYMSNALYLALMGKTLKYYVFKKHDIKLAKHATYTDAFAVLIKIGELEVSREFNKLANLLDIFHIKFEWLPDMLEQM